MCRIIMVLMLSLFTIALMFQAYLFEDDKALTTIATKFTYGSLYILVMVYIGEFSRIRHAAVYAKHRQWIWSAFLAHFLSYPVAFYFTSHCGKELNNQKHLVVVLFAWWVVFLLGSFLDSQVTWRRQAEQEELAALENSGL